MIFKLSLVADIAIPKMVPAMHSKIPMKINKYMFPTMVTSIVRTITTTISVNDIMTTMNDSIICVMNISTDLTPASKVRFQTPSIRLCAILKHEKPMAGKIKVLKKYYFWLLIVGSINFKFLLLNCNSKGANIVFLKSSSSVPYKDSLKFIGISPIFSF